MNNSTNFSGNSVFGQLISLIPKQQVQSAVNKYQSDKFTKRFSTWEHLVSMLFATASNTTSLRDVTNGFLGLEGKLKHLNLKQPPKRSTISDANKRRSYLVFEKIYYDLLNQYKPILSDSRFKNEFGKELSIIDSTTIFLFKDILKCVGRNPESGKRKGGIKVHMQIRADYNSPVLVKFTDATTHDSSFMQDIKFNSDQIYVFDKGYNDYERFESFNANKIPFVTRLKHNAAYRRKKEFELAADSNQAILLDEQIVLQIRENGKTVRGLPLRRVVYWDEKHQVCYEFISNIYELSADQITQIYKSRWQIETLHKQLKQNQSLNYFLGDNVNAIIIQIWCALIWNLLLTVIQRQIKAKAWAFSNLASVIRLHLFNYIHLNSFLKNPEKHYHQIITAELNLFDG
ncbi:MAG: IS4 family transposase [Bacteroidota bacterium]|jgi:hypothetical protein